MAKQPQPTRTTVSLYEAKTHLSELAKRAAAGEEIIVTKHGKPLFRLTGTETAHRRPVPGSFPFSDNEGQRAALAAVDWFERDEELERSCDTRE